MEIFLEIFQSSVQIIMISGANKWWWCLYIKICRIKWSLVFVFQGNREEKFQVIVHRPLTCQIQQFWKSWWCWIFKGSLGHLGESLCWGRKREEIDVTNSQKAIRVASIGRKGRSWWIVYKSCNLYNLNEKLWWSCNKFNCGWKDREISFIKICYVAVAIEESKNSTYMSIKEMQGYLEAHEKGYIEQSNFLINY